MRAARICIIAVVTLLCGCGTEEYKPEPIPPAKSNNEEVMTLCGAGLDKERRAYLSAQLQQRGGVVDAAFRDSARAAIFAMLKDMGLSSADAAQAAPRMYSDYISCVLKVKGDSTQRYEAAACRRACCNFHQCDKDCAMTVVEGMSIPVGDGDSCPSYSVPNEQCGLFATPMGPQYLCRTVGRTRVTYTELKRCIARCRPMD